MEPIPFSGLSMNPLLIEGDLIHIEKIDDKIRLGEVLLFKDLENGEFVVHRVIQEKPLLTKGDWSIQSEAPKENEVFARVKGFSRKGERFSFSYGFPVFFYLFFSKKLLSPFRLIRQFSRVMLILSSPFLFSKLA
jgi:signal peptidase I